MLFLASDPNNPCRQDGPLFWVRVTSFVAGARIRFDNGRWQELDALRGFLPANGRPFHLVELDGTAQADASNDVTEPYPGTAVAQGPAPLRLLKRVDVQGAAAADDLDVGLFDTRGMSELQVYVRNGDTEGRTVAVMAELDGGSLTHEVCVKACSSDSTLALFLGSGAVGPLMGGTYDVAPSVPPFTRIGIPTNGGDGGSLAVQVWGR